jgi:Co/Zn/Cd efflux system component
MVEMGFAAGEHLLAHSSEPRGDRRWNRSLAQQVLRASRGRCCFVPDSGDAGGLHFVFAECFHVVVDTEQARSLQCLLTSMARARSTATWCMESLTWSFFWLSHLSHTDDVDAVQIPTPPQIRRRILRIQTFTLVWMTAEAVVALASAWQARSPALLGFGGDSFIELLSAAVVLWRFRDAHTDERTEKRTAQVGGILLLALAVFVIIASTAALLGYSEARTSPVGIVLLLVAAIVMPWLAAQKRHLAARTGSGALRADAAESALCGYMAWIALAGLIVNAGWGNHWADPLAALCLTPIIVREGWEAMQGKTCRDC